MKKLTVKESIAELIEQGRHINMIIIPEEKVKLIELNSMGSIKRIRFYDYTIDDQKRLKKTLNKRAAKLQKQWSPYFKELLPTVFELGLEVDMNHFCVIVNSEKKSSTYSYSATGLEQYISDLTEMLLVAKGLDNQQLVDNNQTSVANSSQQSQKERELIKALQDQLDEDAANEFVESLTPEQEDVLSSYLEPAARS